MMTKKIHLSPHVPVPPGHEICSYCRGWSLTGIPAEVGDPIGVVARDPWKCWICDGAGHKEPEPPDPPELPPTFSWEENQVAWNMANNPNWLAEQATTDAQSLIAALKKMRVEFDIYQSRNPEPPDPWDI